MSTKSHSRRSIIAAGSAATALASLGAAANAEAFFVDPIFAAIARHEASELRFCAACNLIDEVPVKRDGRAITGADEAEFEAAEAEYDLALDALLATPPMTKAGARAGLDYFVGLDDRESLAGFAEALRDS